MKSFDLIIKNGNVVLEHEVKRLDIGMKDGKIVELAASIDDDCPRMIDATDQYILPGMIDIHVHFSEPGRTEWEGFATGSAALAKGGCTSYFDMPLNGIPSTTTVKALQEKVEFGKEKSLLNFGLWGGLVPGNIGELEGMVTNGVIGFKAFLSPTGTKEFEAVDNDTLYEGMKEIKRLGKILALHAENTEIVTELAEQKQQQGLSSALDYTASRPVAAEVEAVKHALVLAEETGCALHFVHISSADAVDLIQLAKEKGLDVSLETCPHYLWFSEKDLEEKGTVLKCAPPIRNESEKQRLVEKVVNGKIEMISSDHSPCLTNDKLEHEQNFFKAWGGISGGQTSLEAVLDCLYLDGGMSLPDVARLIATNQAKRFGMFPNKGVIQVDADADIVIVNDSKKYVLMVEDLLYKNPHSPYVGETFRCKVMTTICNGRVVYGEGVIQVDTNAGNWINPLVNSVENR